MSRARRIIIITIIVLVTLAASVLGYLLVSAMAQRALSCASVFFGGAASEEWLCTNGRYWTGEEAEQMFLENQEEFQYIADLVLSKDALMDTEQMQYEGDMIIDPNYCKNYFTEEEWSAIRDFCDKYGLTQLCRYRDSGVGFFFGTYKDEANKTETSTSLRYSKNKKSRTDSDCQYFKYIYVLDNWWIQTTHFSL